MNRVSLEEICRYFEHTVLFAGAQSLFISQISTDSRSIQGLETLFIPLKGEYFDGHDFLSQVIPEVLVVLVELKKWPFLKESPILKKKIKSPKKFWVLGVQDTLRAYQQIAQGYLKTLNIIKVGITGSNGKTSTREMMCQILSKQYHLIASEGNFNNQVGVPKTILRIEDRHELAFIEMGSGKKGDIRRLAEIVCPDYGVITNIAESHLEFLENIQGVLEEKKALLLGCANHPLKALLNEDSDHYLFLKEGVNNVLTFSLKRKTHIQVIQDQGLEGYLLWVGMRKAHFPIGGLYNLINLHFAIVLARDLGLSYNQMIQGIESIRPYPLRGEVEKRPLKKGFYTLIQDYYNANPASMKAGLNYFVSIKTKNQEKKIAVLGDMLELGPGTSMFHRELGDYIFHLKLDYILYLGQWGEVLAECWAKYKVKEELLSKVRIFDSYQNLAHYLNQILRPGDLVYSKASRGIQLEKVIAFL